MVIAITIIIIAITVSIINSVTFSPYLKTCYKDLRKEITMFPEAHISISFTEKKIHLSYEIILLQILTSERTSKPERLLS